MAFRQLKSLLLCIVVIISCATVSVYGNEKTGEALPYFKVPFMAKAPQIDGQINYGEWEKAVTVTGFQNYTTGLLDDDSPIVAIGYDKKCLYVCFIVPMQKGQRIVANVKERDGRVQSDDAVGFVAAPVGDEQLRHLSVNSIATLCDTLGGDAAFNGKWQITACKGRSRVLPAVFQNKKMTRFWAIEMAMPFEELKVKSPKVGELWDVNFCVEGGKLLTFAPTYGTKMGFLERGKFAKMQFDAPDSPVASVTGLGDPSVGFACVQGWLSNPTKSPQSFRVKLHAEKKGTYIVERTGYDEIVGAIVNAEKTFDVAPGQTVPILLEKVMEDKRLNLLSLEIAPVSADKRHKPSNLFFHQWNYKLTAPFKAIVENYPSKKKLICRMDASLIAGLDKKAKAKLELADLSGKIIKSDYVGLVDGCATADIDYKSFSPANYSVKIDIVQPDGKIVATSSKEFTCVGKLVWMNNDIGKSRRVIRPFTKMTYSGNSVSVWGRTVTWNEKSMLPASMTSGGKELLAAPIRMVIASDGKEESFPLGKLVFKSQDEDRTEFEITGQTAKFLATVEGWMEYDGLLWVDVEITPKQANTMIDSFRLEIPMQKNQAQYYHGVPDRSLTGAILDKTIKLPFQYYVFIGTPERGLGFVTESLKGFYPYDGKSTYVITPQKNNEVLWQVDFIAQPVNKPSLKYSFGLQATPVKQLPEDYHSWLAELGTSDSGKDIVQKQFNGKFDELVVWNDRKTPFMKAFCDPMGIDTVALKGYVNNIHSRSKSPALIYQAPINFSRECRPEHIIFEHEWMAKPETTWQCDGTVQFRATASSSFTDFLLYALQRAVKESGADGLYFDGDVPFASTNQEVGDGWVDDSGILNPTWPVLAWRDFNKRCAVMLEETVGDNGYLNSNAKHGDSWPKYRMWVHASGSVCPPFHSFSTSLLCGEWFKQARRSGKGYEELLTIDTFRPRYLSQPWGLVNQFLAIAATRQQSESILAYILPQGGAIFPRYFDKPTVVSVIQAMTDFDTRNAKFTPAWGENESLKIVDGGKPEILLGTWERDGKILAVIGNLDKKPASINLNVAENKSSKLSQLYPAATGDKKTIEKGVFTVDIGPNTFTMLLIETDSGK